MTMNTATTTTIPSGRIAAGVTATYLLDLSRRSAGRRAADRHRPIAAARFGRDRDECAAQRRAQALQR